MVDMEVLELALSKEVGAIEAYQSMLATNPGLKDLLYFLVAEEQKHKAMIEKRIAQLMR